MALAAKGFRPFFLLAAAFAVAILPLWMLTLVGILNPTSYLDAVSWHAHEMVFGFAVAVIAGFLLTAVGNWTKRETAVGVPLLALSAVWLLGRIAITGAPLFLHWFTAVADLAFLPVLIVVLARPLIASKNHRNLVMLGLLGALFLANLAIHLDVLGVLPGWRRRGNFFAIDLVILVILLMAGRVFPMFTRNATDVASIRALPALDLATVVAMGTLALLDAFAAPPMVAGAAAGVTGILAAARSVHWGARHVFKLPLVWILHVGYAWIPLGLVLRGLSAFGSAVPSSVATHALTVGGIGALTLGMMSRVALGHTGRALTVSPPVVASFVLVTLAAMVRVLIPLVSPASYRPSLFVAGCLWTAAFGIYLVVHAPMLVTARPDGKVG